MDLKVLDNQMMMDKLGQRLSGLGGGRPLPLPYSMYGSAFSPATNPLLNAYHLHSSLVRPHALSQHRNINDRIYSRSTSRDDVISPGACSDKHGKRFEILKRIENCFVENKTTCTRYTRGRESRVVW